MKFLTSTAVALLIASTEAASLSSMRHHHYPSHYEYVSTLPDVRADTVSDEDIAAHEAARAEAAKVLKNPQNAVLATIKTDLDRSLRTSPSVSHTPNPPETITPEPSALRLPPLSLTTPPTSLPPLRPDQTKP